ncbi:MAG: tRNA (adenosine(37)-N6)-dimethylallyltransferase MiaA [Candidatus Nanopelagicales bacterium]
MAATEPEIVAVVGSTASGKSEVGLHLAASLGGEIVNADAFQLYRGMDIGTAKPGPDERRLVPHHCLDLWDIDEAASVAEYQAVARAAVTDIATRGRVPIVVGGSPLYVRALCDELDLPPNDPELRARLLREAEELGHLAMHERLRERDPAAAADIDPRNLRRVVRALEVVELTGSFRARLPPPVPWRTTTFMALTRSRPELDERIDRRTRDMWSVGLLDEVTGLLAAGLATAPTASRAVGYTQAIAHLEGRLSRDDAIADTVRATRALARRQERTFRGDARVVWVTGVDDALAVIGDHRTRR